MLANHVDVNDCHPLDSFAPIRVIRGPLFLWFSCFLRLFFWLRCCRAGSFVVQFFHSVNGKHLPMTTLSDCDQPDAPEKVTIPELGGVFTERWSLSKVGRMMAMFGPAAVVASVAIGAGETIVVVRAGSWAGYNLMWLVLLSVIVKGIFVTYMVGRYTAISGQLLGHRLVRLPGPRGWFLIAIIVLEMLAAPPVWTSVSKPCGALLCHLASGAAALLGAPEWLLAWTSFDSTANVLTTLFVAAALIVALRLSYEKLERQQLIICGLLVGGTAIGTLMVRPDLWEALRGCFRFGYATENFPSWTKPEVREHPWVAMATAFGYVGGLVMGYIVYANWIGIHHWGLTGHPDIEAIRRRAAQQDRIDYLPDDPVQVRRLLRSLAPLRWDVALGAGVLLVVTTSFMMAGAAVLYPMLASGELSSSFEDWSLLTDQAHIWRNISEKLVWVYYVCVAAALWGTLQALPEIYARVIKEFCDAIAPRKPFDYRQLRSLICGYIFIGTTLLIWSPINFNIMTQVVAFLSTNMAVSLVMLAALYLNVTLPRPYRPGRLMLLGSVLSVIVLCIVSIISGYGLTVELLSTF